MEEVHYIKTLVFQSYCGISGLIPIQCWLWQSMIQPCNLLCKVDTDFNITLTNHTILSQKERDTKIYFPIMTQLISPTSHKVIGEKIFGGNYDRVMSILLNHI